MFGIGIQSHVTYQGHAKLIDEFKTPCLADIVKAEWKLSIHDKEGNELERKPIKISWTDTSKDLIHAENVIFKVKKNCIVSSNVWMNEEKIAEVKVPYTTCVSVNGDLTYEWKNGFIKLK